MVKVVRCGVGKVDGGWILRLKAVEGSWIRDLSWKELYSLIMKCRMRMMWALVL